ncbi:hypothetical protein SB18R_03305 [Pseudomonas oryzihabitans]|nr:hypothetical protein SB9_12540 [Pseudomonas psychrotolerans]KTT78270.1 hypothetical protein SB18R_03305 [Pseudomonas psychrotolerans]
MKSLLALLLVLPVSSFAGNFATCILDKVPGVKNDNAAGAAFQVCNAKYPDRYQGVTQGDGRGIWSYDSGAECALAKARDTLSSDGAGMIRVACNALYNEPVGTFGDLKKP